MWSALRRRGGEKAAGGQPRPSERLRIPQPLIKRRLPSGRGATEQPNVTSDGDTALTPVFWLKQACGIWPRRRQGANGPRRRVTTRSVRAQTA